MTRKWRFSALLVLALALPTQGQVQSESDVDSLLKAASKALAHYEQLAPAIHCEQTTKAELRDECQKTVEGLAARAREAKAEIARYRQLSSPQSVDLFHAYEIFRRVMEPLVILCLTPEPRLWGERNQRLFAEAYNSFVKVTAWFGGVVEQTLREDGRCGDPVAGIALCISPIRSTLELRNSGDEDTVINLGTMLANGARQYPTAVRLVMKEANGREHQAEFAEPTGILGGRLDPLIVPLPHGASLNLPLDIFASRLSYGAGRMEDFEPDPRQRYTLQAQFTGKGVSQAEASPDLKGTALMPFWTGTVLSNVAPLGVK